MRVGQEHGVEALGRDRERGPVAILVFAFLVHPGIDQDACVADGKKIAGAGDAFSGAEKLESYAQIGSPVCAVARSMPQLRAPYNSEEGPMPGRFHDPL
jgi:hypothetical protein